MKILSGIYVKDGGTVSIDGKKTELGDVEESRALGISMIYQEMENIQKLSVAGKHLSWSASVKQITGFY